MRRRSSNVVILAALLCTPLLAQESDFFEQKSSYFQSQTLEGVSKHAEAPTEAPATVTVISKEEIELYGFRTVADVLNFASIGYFTHSDRRYDFAGGRGLFFYEDFNTRLLVMMNGHPLNEPWNNFAGVGREMLIPLDLVDRIEIIYGPSSLLYGGYSLYGIVNVVTQNGSTLSGTRLRAAVGTWRTLDGSLTWGATGTTPANKEWNVLASAGGYRSSGEDLRLALTDVDYAAQPDGGQVYGGPQSGTDAERSPFGFLYAQRGDFSLMARAGYRRHGSPLAPYESTYGSRDEFVQDDKDLIELRWRHDLAAGVNISTRAFYDWYHYQEHDPYIADGYKFILSTTDSDPGAEVRLTAQRGAHLLTGGAEYRKRRIVQVSRNDAYPGAEIDPSDVRVHIGGELLVLYLQEEWRPNDHWTLVAGGNFADTRPGGSKAQPRVAAIYKPRHDLAIKALYGRGFRPPSIFEADYADYITGLNNPSLSSEEIASTELSLIWNASPSTAVQAYAFDSTIKGLIRQVPIEDLSQVEGGVLPPSGDPNDLIGLNQYQSTGDVDSHGFGASVKTRRERLRGYVNVAYSTATLHNREHESLPLPATSSWLGSAGIGYDTGTLAGSLVGRYVGPQRYDPARSISGKSSSFVEANGRLLWRTSFVYPITFTVDVLNLFDTKGSIPASPIYTPANIPIEGRRAVLGAELRF